jgi:hypothetical protein
MVPSSEGRWYKKQLALFLKSGDLPTQDPACAEEVHGASGLLIRAKNSV